MRLLAIIASVAFTSPALTPREASRVTRVALATHFAPLISGPDGRFTTSAAHCRTHGRSGVCAARVHGQQQTCTMRAHVRKSSGDYSVWLENVRCVSAAKKTARARSG